MEQAKSAERFPALDLLRIVALFFMVQIHAAIPFWGDSFGTAGWAVYNFYESISRFCVPVFFMLSGAFLLNPDKDVSLSSLLRVRLPRLVAAFLFWSGVYVLTDGLIRGPEGPWATFMALTAGHYHMWFVFSIAGLYLVTPLLRPIAANRKLTDYFLLLWALFSVLLPTFNEMRRVRDLLPSLLDMLGMQTVLGYAGYYLLGHRLTTVRWKAPMRIALYCLGLLGAMLTAWATARLSTAMDAPSQWYYGYLRPGVACAAVAMFVLFFAEGARVRFSPRAAACLKTLSGLSLGVYLIHDLFITFFSLCLNLTAGAFTPVLAVPVMTLCVWAASLGAVWLLSRIPFVKKWLL